jgi:predicted nucleic acid-binding protein
MTNKILIDTSAWIVSFRTSGNEKLKQTIIHALDTDAVLITNLIKFELLQGCLDKKEYITMKSRLDAIEELVINDTVWDVAYNTGYNLRRSGITVSTVDILIASIASAYGCNLLHHDRHFRLIATKLSISIMDFLD